MTDASKKGRSQAAMLRQHLEDGNAISYLSALDRFGIANLKGRIWDLRKAGLSIRTGWVAFVSRSGHAGQYAVYSLDQDNIEETAGDVFD